MGSSFSKLESGPVPFKSVPLSFVGLFLNMGYTISSLSIDKTEPTCENEALVPLYYQTFTSPSQFGKILKISGLLLATYYYLRHFFASALRPNVTPIRRISDTVGLALFIAQVYWTVFRVNPAERQATVTTQLITDRRKKSRRLAYVHQVSLIISGLQVLQQLISFLNGAPRV
eukprot:TRINITY_DN9091_c0_g1_i1.p1 TRINITY_DN9091_c0_g1~~TRINITY_DN9091_c0_g1_i1.p1  ORF type:complete len:183 (-),score=20.44 TRINITY_DN9091_c0_g1_i1:161-679(-)